jgi:nicotinate-nucleotide adenylyltransferase
VNTGQHSAPATGAQPPGVDADALLVFYGGTFDPIHNGHLAIARAARDTLGTPVRLMPAADPPHREVPGATADQRVRMLELAVADEPGLRVDRRELDRAGRSYTIETLHELRRQYGAQTPVALLIGADSLLGLPGWRQWQEMFALTHFVVAERPGNPLEGPWPPALSAATAGRWTDDPTQLRAGPGGHLLRLHQPLHPESATRIRQLRADGGDWASLVPPAVAHYIRGQRLYLDGG